jgi:hypothetical protein
MERRLKHEANIHDVRRVRCRSGGPRKSLGRIWGAARKVIVTIEQGLPKRTQNMLDTENNSYYHERQVSSTYPWMYVCGGVPRASSSRAPLNAVCSFFAWQTLVSHMPITGPAFSTTSQHCTKWSLRYYYALAYSSNVRRALLGASLRSHCMPEASVLSQCNSPQSRARIQKRLPLLTHYYSLPQARPGSQSAKVFSITLGKSYSATSSKHSLHDESQTQTRWQFTTPGP